MASWFVRVALIRLVGRRVIPVLMAYDFFRFLQAARRYWTKPDR